MAKAMRLALFLGAVTALWACSPKSDEKGESAEKDEATKPAAKTDAVKAATPAAAGPIAKVNGVDLPRAEFDKKYAKMTKAFTTRNKQIPEGLAKRYKESILKQLIDKQLLKQKIAAANVKVDDADLESEFADYKKMFRTDENFQRYLKSSEISVEQIRGNIAHNLAVQKLLEKQGDLKVPDEEVTKYYEDNKSRYEVKEQVRASHILLKVSPKDDKAASAAAKKKADKIYKEVSKKGADFAALAKKHSQGPTAPRGGDLSFFTRGRMVPAFEKVAFAMKKGEISKPVKTQFGWHIIKVTDKKEGRQRPFDEVKESITKLLVNKKSRKAKAGLLKELRASAKIESFLPKMKGPITKPNIKAKPLMVKPAAKPATDKATPKPK